MCTRANGLASAWLEAAAPTPTESGVSHGLLLPGNNALPGFQIRKEAVHTHRFIGMPATRYHT